MAIFDDPFDSARVLRGGCICGRHRSVAEHDQATHKPRCEVAESEDKRYEGIVASAVMRAVFRKMPRGAPS